MMPVGAKEVVNSNTASAHTCGNMTTQREREDTFTLLFGKHSQYFTVSSYEWWTTLKLSSLLK